MGRNLLGKSEGNYWGDCHIVDLEKFFIYFPNIELMLNIYVFLHVTFLEKKNLSRNVGFHFQTVMLNYSTEEVE